MNDTEETDQSTNLVVTIFTEPEHMCHLRFINPKIMQPF